MSATRTQICCLWLGLLGCAFAQEKADVPTPAQPPLYQQDSETAVTPDKAAPVVADTRPLTGSQTLTLGGTGLPSHFAPRLHFSQTVTTNPQTGSSDSDLLSLTSVSGELELQRRSRTKEFTANYAGGGLFYGNRGQSTGILPSPNSTFQRLSLSERAAFGHWSVFATDEVSYISAASLGGGFAPGIGLAGGASGFASASLGGLNPGLVPSQNLVEQIASQVSNTVVLESEYRFGGRSSITFGGNYGLLKSPDGNLIDSNQQGFRGGYNRSITARDTIGIGYQFMQYGFPGTGARLRSHAAQLMYGRRIAGRLSLQLGAGAGTNIFASNGVSNDRLLWNAAATVHYRFTRTDLSVSYARAINAGSGVQLGSNSDTVYGTVSRGLLRRWESTASVGYSRNLALATSNQFSTYFVSANMRRNIGRYSGVFVNYSFQKQDGLLSCPTCSTDSIRHSATIGFDWGFRPIRLE